MKRSCERGGEPSKRRTDRSLVAMQRSELIGLIKARATPRELLDFLDQQSQDFILYTDDLKIFIEGRASGNFRITIYQAGKNSELYILSIQDFFNDKTAFVGWP